MKRISTVMLALLLFSTACSDDTVAVSDSSDGDVASEPADDVTAEASEDDVETDQPGDPQTSTQTTTVNGDEAVSNGEETPETPLRIVSISPTATEMLFAVGAGDLVVAVDQFSYYPDEAPVTDLDGFSPNVEAIASYEPDLVLMQSGGDLKAGLESLGIEVLVQDAAVSLDDTYAQILEIGEVTGQTDDAAVLVNEMKAEIDSLIADAPQGAGLTYFHELDPTLYSVTSSTFIGAVYGLFGLENVADPADADGSAFGYPQLSDEYLVDTDPDLIFLADTLCCGQNAATVAERPAWEQLSAVRNGNVIELNDDIASRWGPRIVEFIAAISEAIRNL